jgi:hypothetical protein
MKMNISNIIEESLFNEVKKAIINENKDSKEMFQITCEGEPVESFESEEIAMKHLDIYKKKHPKKEFIIEKVKYGSPNEMIDKLDQMGEELEKNKETNKMKKTTVSGMAEAILSAKDKGLKEFKFNGKKYNVDESWSELEEMEGSCEECGQGYMEEDSDIEESNAFILAADKAKDAGKKEFEFPKGSGKMHKVTLSKDIDTNEAWLRNRERKYEPYYSDDNDSDTPDYWIKNHEGNKRLFVPSGEQDVDSFKTEKQDWLKSIGDKHGLEPEVVQAAKRKYFRPIDAALEPQDDNQNFVKQRSEKGEDTRKYNRKYNNFSLNEEGMCNECGSPMNEEGMCNECGTGMYESKKPVLRLNESELVSLIKKMVVNTKKNLSEAIPGLEVTKKAQSGSKKDGDEAMKIVKDKLKKASSFDGNDNPEFPNQISKGDKMAVNPNKEEEEYIDDNMKGGTLLDLDYDFEPSEGFKKRLKMALEGDPTMGNSQDAANVIKTKTGENLSKSAERKKQKEKDTPEAFYGARGVQPLKVKTVNESKTTMTSIVNEEISRMKKIIGYDESTQ